MGASVATFDDTMAEIVYELDDREIFNDIRSELFYSESEEVIDSPEEHDSETIYKTYSYIYPGSIQFTVDKKPEHSDITWRTANVVYARAQDIMTYAACQAVGGDWFDWDSTCLFDYGQYISVSILSRSSDSCVIRITNTGTIKTKMYGVKIAIRYKYKVSDEVTHVESVQRTLMVRATDSTSIAKYGRRVMDLTWPMGATQVQAQSMVDSYRDRYSEPVARIKMIVKGVNDALKAQILARKISDKITVISSNLGLNSDFFINYIDLKIDPEALPTVIWILEEVRSSEAAGVFVIDTSEIDGSALIG